MVLLALILLSKLIVAMGNLIKLTCESTLIILVNLIENKWDQNRVVEIKCELNVFPLNKLSPPKLKFFFEC